MKFHYGLDPRGLSMDVLAKKLAHLSDGPMTLTWADAFFSWGELYDEATAHARIAQRHGRGRSRAAARRRARRGSAS